METALELQNAEESNMFLLTSSISARMALKNVFDDSEKMQY